MTITELINALQAFPNPDTTDCVVNGYEGGYCDLTPNKLVLKQVLCNVNDEHWYGPHDELDSTCEPSRYITKDCILLSRSETFHY